MLFLANMLSKMKHSTSLGSRIVNKMTALGMPDTYCAG